MIKLLHLIFKILVSTVLISLTMLSLFSVIVVFAYFGPIVGLAYTPFSILLALVFCNSLIG